MFTRDLKECTEIIAGDATLLKEIFHPDKDGVNLRYSLAHARLQPGTSSKPHKLRTSEVYYILSGEGVMHINDETGHVRTDQTVYIPPDALQHIENTGTQELVFLAIVDPAWRKKDEYVMS